MIERLPRARRNLVLVALAVLVAWFAWTIRAVLNPLLVGYLLAYILHPVVVRVQEFGLSRRVAVNLTFLSCFLGFLGLATVLTLQVNGLAHEVVGNQELRDTVQARFNNFTVWVREKTSLDLGEISIPDTPEELEEIARGVVGAFGSGGDVSAEGAETRTSPYLEIVDGKSAMQTAGTFLSQLFAFLARSFGRLFEFGSYVFLVPLYAYFLLFELGRLHDFLSRYVPKGERARVVSVARQIGEVIANFFRGRLAVCFFKGLFLSVGLLIADVDYAFLFGMTAGFLSLIPFVGAMAGFLAAFLVAVIEHSVVGSFVRTGIVFGIGELLEGYVLMPKILGNSLGLHELVVLFSMLAGGAALGVLGILISLPLTATLVILAREFVMPALRDWADEERGPPPEPDAT